MTLRRVILIQLMGVAVWLIVGVYFFWPGEVQATASIIFTVLVMAANGWEWFKPEGGELDESKRVMLRRIILLAMAVIAFGMMLGVYLFWPGDVQATAGIILAVLVMAANAWEWFKPEGEDQADGSRVMLRRIILLAMAAIAFGMMMAVSASQPGKVVVFLCTIYAIPVIVVNLWEYLRKILGDTRPMTRRRKLLAGLLAVAGLIVALYSFWPDEWLEYLCILYAVPVVLANGWEWLDPEFMEKMVGLFGKEKGKAATEELKEGEDQVLL